jgi:hypothetical protein
MGAVLDCVKFGRPFSSLSWLERLWVELDRCACINYELMWILPMEMPKFCSTFDWRRTGIRIVFRMTVCEAQK